MKRKRWLRSNAASVPRVAIRTQFPWRVRVVLLAAFASVILLIVATALLAYHYSRPATTLDDGVLGAAEVARAREEAKQAVAGRERSTALAVQLENQLQIDRATQQQVQAQLKALENENARLKEDLSFFESLLPTPANSKGVVIRSFRLQALNDGPETGREPVRTTSGGPNQEPQALRYRLLVQQSGRPERDFVGLVSLTVSLQQGGRPWILQLPDATIPDAGPAPLSFRHYQRVEGVFELPEGAVVRSVQVKIQANGEVRAQQTFTM